MSGYTPGHLKEKLEKELNPVHCEVTDLSDGCGGKFDVLVVSEKFQGEKLLARHRMVNKILEEELKTIHALTIKSWTPEQWQEKQNGQ